MILSNRPAGTEPDSKIGWPRIAVVGAGAVGGYFGGIFALAGAPVVMIGRKSFVDAVNATGLTIETASGEKRVNVEATPKLAAIANGDLILVCVKSNDTIAVAKEMAPFVSRDAVVVSLQNGVDNAENIRRATKIDALPAAVYIAVSAPQPGLIKHLARGDIVVGPENDRTLRVKEIFDRAKIGCQITNNINGEMWIKLLCNAALNAVSALGHTRYGEIAGNADARALMQEIVKELMAVADAEGIVLPGINNSTDGLAVALEIANQMPAAFSSTAQDIQRGKRSEIDSLNGYIARRGAERDIPTPVNHALFTLVKLIEQNFSA